MFCDYFSTLFFMEQITHTCSLVASGDMEVVGELFAVGI